MEPYTFTFRSGSVLMERIASEFNKLQYSVSQTCEHPLVEQIKPVSEGWLYPQCSDVILPSSPPPFTSFSPPSSPPLSPFPPFLPSSSLPPHFLLLSSSSPPPFHSSPFLLSSSPPLLLSSSPSSLHLTVSPPLFLHSLLPYPSILFSPPPSSVLLPSLPPCRTASRTHSERAWREETRMASPAVCRHTLQSTDRRLLKTCFRVPLCILTWKRYKSFLVRCHLAI